MIGKSRWTCGNDGTWNARCVKCIGPDQYCDSPCVPLGSEVVSLTQSFSYGSELEFICSNQDVVIGTVTRKCLKNRKWTGTDIDCTGETFEPRSEKTGLRGFRPGPTQTRLYSYR